ncbi:nitrite reductase small subunit NirD [Microbacterium telephonicum]|uniref:Assimilatory nitrite reductase (NAD(P)H) small subunit n=1 Tax=Microbacterium telephonicum TaxID=1714841 RepID=A0A498BV07_9MICO|nr:nitrite reductase small subunit NirD [Microbacterium telephonicum]RLK47342.1 assimilatory nitrite reductase (NAD(P)H) small subunit [Microbacterium telephonicum]
MTLDLPRTATWRRVCAVADLEIERGRAALLDGIQVALVLTRDGSVYAVDNRDPYSGAHVISRGIVGTRGSIPTIASPMYKQSWDLRSGVCVESQGKEPRPLRTWLVDVRGGDVMIFWEATP